MEAFTPTRYKTVKNPQIEHASGFSSAHCEEVLSSLYSRKLSPDFGEDVLDHVVLTCFQFLLINPSHTQHRNDSRAKIIGNIWLSTQASAGCVLDRRQRRSPEVQNRGSCDLQKGLQKEYANIVNFMC